jgi:hypothetical protein
MKHDSLWDRPRTCIPATLLNDSCNWRAHLNLCNNRVALRFHFDLGDHRKSFDRLRSYLENRRTSGEMRFSLKTSEQTYSPKCHSKRMALNPNVRLVCDMELYFHQPSHNSCFLVLGLCFSRNRTDDMSFLSIRGYGVSRELHGGALWLG